jgi:hypothetical protein
MADEQIIAPVQTSTTNTIVKDLFYKNEGFSITRTILVVSWIVVILKYIFTGITMDFGTVAVASKTVKTVWALTFNSTDAATILGSASALYFANHNITYKK